MDDAQTETGAANPVDNPPSGAEIVPSEAKKPALLQTELNRATVCVSKWTEFGRRFETAMISFRGPGRGLATSGSAPQAPNPPSLVVGMRFLNDCHDSAQVAAFGLLEEMEQHLNVSRET